MQNGGKRILKWTGIIAAIFISGWVIYLNAFTLVLLMISFLLAYILNPAVTCLTEKGIPRTGAIGVLVLAALTLIACLTLFLLSQTTRHSSNLFDPNAEFHSKTAEKTPESSVQQGSFVLWFDRNINPLLERWGAKPVDEQHLHQYIQSLFKWIEIYYPAWIKPLWTAFQSMFAGAASFIVGMLNLLLLPVFTFYLLRDYPKIGPAFSDNLPPHWRAQVADWAGEIDKAVGGFLRGQFSIALILALINAAGLTLLGIPYGALVGVVAGLANMVPYMSIVVGLFPALLLSFLDQPDLSRLLWIIVIFCGAQMLEGFYLSPRIMGKEVDLHPVWIMLSIIFGGSLFGLVGIILAVPAGAIIKVIVTRCHHAWKEHWPVIS